MRTNQGEEGLVVHIIDLTLQIWKLALGIGTKWDVLNRNEYGYPAGVVDAGCSPGCRSIGRLPERYVCRPESDQTVQPAQRFFHKQDLSHWM